mmetsp:Transcript_13860/g.22967  ORF Transcript_13860/g.22967 Transcript_13860/m.22967 type:complete len:242 (+) Transcript_13860:113-838(+)
MMQSTYLVFVTALLLGSTNGFGVAPPSSVQRLGSTSLSYSEHMQTLDKSRVSVEPGFEERMREAVKVKRATKTNKATGRPGHVHEALTMKAFNKLVTEEKDQLVVVRFYAPWCRACKAVSPSYSKFSKDLKASGKSVKFVDCPMTSVNTEIHKSLGINAIPFAHVYHPETGLAEERKLSRKNYANFEKVVNSYVAGSCNLRSNNEDLYTVDPWQEKVASKSRSTFKPLSVRPSFKPAVVGV